MKKSSETYTSSEVSPENSSGSSKLKALVLASVVSVLWYEWYQYVQKQIPEAEVPTQPDTIAATEYVWKEIDVKSHQKDWQEAAIALTDALSEDKSQKEKEIFQKVYLALITHESSWYSNAMSPTGAAGLWQLTSSVFNDMLDRHRQKKYLSRLLEVKKHHPEIIKKLPKDVYESVMAIDENVSDEDWSVFVWRAKFYAYNAENIDPHTNLLISSIYYDLIYSTKNSYESSSAYKRIDTATKGTKFSLPRSISYGPIIQKHIATLESYNGDNSIDSTVSKSKPLAEKQKYVSSVLSKVQFSHNQVPSKPQQQDHKNK